MTKPRPFTALDLARLRRYAAEGRSQTAIARAMDRSVGSIAGALSKNGIKTFGESGRAPVELSKAPDYTEADLATARRMADAGSDAEQIAHALGRTLGGLRMACTRHGIDILSRAEITARAVAASVDRWPADARFEDHPRAPEWEPRWRAPPVLPWSPVGSAAAMCVGGGSAKASAVRMRGA